MTSARPIGLRCLHRLPPTSKIPEGGLLEDLLTLSLEVVAALGAELDGLLETREEGRLPCERIAEPASLDLKSGSRSGYSASATRSRIAIPPPFD
mmetsp:Transcript_31558/g.76180  ORF Transcript_31558/g.76180 Transcript_31558/m.76180 type:complete len:95 (-) Transcript_31558:402-686(-)